MTTAETIWSSIEVFPCVADAARFRFAHLPHHIGGRPVRPTTTRVEGGIRLHLVATA